MSSVSDLKQFTQNFPMNISDTEVGRDRRPWRPIEQDKQNISKTFVKYLY